MGNCRSDRVCRARSAERTRFGTVNRLDHSPSGAPNYRRFYFVCSSALAKLATQKKQYAIQSTIYSQDLDTKVCRTVPGLTKAQMGLCYQQPDTFVVALEGLNEAVKECQHQFHGHRWNCSSLSTKSQNPYISAIFQRGNVLLRFIKN